MKPGATDQSMSVERRADAAVSEFADGGNGVAFDTDITVEPRVCLNRR